MALVGRFVYKCQMCGIKKTGNRYEARAMTLPVGLDDDDIGGDILGWFHDCILGRRGVWNKLGCVVYEEGSFFDHPSYVGEILPLIASRIGDFLNAHGRDPQTIYVPIPIANLIYLDPGIDLDANIKSSPTLLGYKVVFGSNEFRIE